MRRTLQSTHRNTLQTQQTPKELIMSKQTVTARLYALFDKVADAASITVDMARTMAVANKLNATSAEIAFYRWRMDRGFYVKSAPAMVR